VVGKALAGLHALHVQPVMQQKINGGAQAHVSLSLANEKGQKA
jgi:hypothetical protein